MPLSINTNVASLTAQRAMMNSNAGLESAFERLSTGKRINSAADDAAGLAIGKDLESRVSGLNQAIRNVNDGISMVQIAEGSLDEATTILQRMRDLAVQASNGSLSSTEQQYLDTEHEKLAETLDKVVAQAAFNNISMLGSADVTKSIQSGADSGEVTSVTFQKIGDTILGIDKDQVNLAGATSAKEQIQFDGLGLSTQKASVDLTLTLSDDASNGVAENNTFTVKIAGNSYTHTVQGGAAIIGTDNFTVANLQASLSADTQFSSVATFSVESGKLRITLAGADGDLGTVSDTSFSVAGASLANSHTATSTAATVTATGGIQTTDVFTLTVGSDVVTATGEYTTKSALATALNTAVGNAGITDYTVKAVGGEVAVEYAANGNQGLAASSYSLVKTTGITTGGADDSVGTISVQGASTASDAITAIDDALAEVAKDRAVLGATQSQLESTVRNLANVAENTSAAAGRIMDTDYAAETANLTKAQILQQAATSILAQANAQPQSVLSLLQ
jgi:flagellin